jgi:SAM-dependent methyltransferase
VEGHTKNTQTAGVSSSGIDVAEVFERLKREVRGQPSSAPHTGGPLAARADAERFWAVVVDVPIERRRGVRGWLVARVKGVMRRLMSWYVGPFAADQRSFNRQALLLVDELHERLERLERQALVNETRLASVEERQGAADGQPFVDYFAFESRMRGTVEEIRERQRPYVEDFRRAAPVLDVGCGRGEFLSLLREAGIDARGVDVDPNMAAFAARDGLEVVVSDAVAYLEVLEDGSLGGLFSAQVVEHLAPAQLVRFLELAARKLRSGGLFIAETINPLSPVALRNYFADLTHVQPLVPETLAMLVEQAGLRVDETRYLHEPQQRLWPIEATDVAGSDAFAHNIALLNEHVFAPLDYAVVARRQ